MYSSARALRRMWKIALVMLAESARSKRRCTISLCGVDDVAQHREQVLLDAADHLAVDEGAGRRVLHLELDAPGLAHDAQLEVLVALEDQARRRRSACRSSAPPARSGETAGKGRPARGRAACRPPAARGCRARPSATPAHARLPRGRAPGCRSRPDLDRRAESREQPEVEHVLVRQRDAAVGPVRAEVTAAREYFMKFGRPCTMIEPPGAQPFRRAIAMSAGSGYDTCTARKKSLCALRRVRR